MLKKHHKDAMTKDIRHILYAFGVVIKSSGSVGRRHNFDE